MATLTTTIEAIRDGQIALIRALAPTSHAKHGFEVAEDMVDFRKWARKQTQAAFRKFTVEERTDYPPPEVSNTQVEFLTSELLVSVAYPKKFSRFGPDNMRDLSDVADSDFHQIDSAIGHRAAANYVSGQCSAVRSSKILEEGAPEDPVSLLQIRYTVTFYRGFP